MIRDATAQRIASEWHSGQWSALYALSSSGAILGEQNEEYDWNQADEEIRGCLNFNDTYEGKLYSDCTAQEQKDLTNLLAYVQAKGPRGPVPGWYEKTIARQK